MGGLLGGVSFGGGNKASSLLWTKGAVGSRSVNLTKHFVKHGKEVGTKSKLGYTFSGYKTVASSVKKYTYKSGRTIYQDSKGRVTVMQNKRLVTHFSPNNPNNYWKNQIGK